MLDAGMRIRDEYYQRIINNYRFALVSVSQKRAAAYRRYAFRWGLGMLPQQAGRNRGDTLHCLLQYV